MNKADGYWSPYISGFLIGVTLLCAFLIFGWGLGASSAFSIIPAAVLRGINPEYIERIRYFSMTVGNISPFESWIMYEISGIFAGALFGAVTARKFSLRFDRGAAVSIVTRFVLAISGGILMGFAARMARGCTSGVALSGGAQLAIGGWVFVIAMFACGFAFSVFMRRFWS